MRVFNDQLIHSRPDLAAVTADRYNVAQQTAKGFITELTVEIAELSKKRNDLEQRHGLDAPHRLVLLLSSLPTLLNKDPQNTVVDFKLPDTNCVRRCAALLDQEVDLQRLRSLWAVDVILDPDTAHCDLIVSPNGKTANITQC